MNPITIALLAFGAVANASIYFVLVFLAAASTGHPHAMYADIIAVGITYLSFTVQLLNRVVLGTFLVVASVLAGTFAGVLLLV